MQVLKEGEEDDSQEVRFTARQTKRTMDAIAKLASKLGHSNNSMMGILLHTGLEQYQTPRLYYYKVIDNNMVAIWDSHIRQIVIVIREGKTIYCDLDLVQDCIHCEFVRKIPRFMERKSQG